MGASWSAIVTPSNEPSLAALHGKYNAASAYRFGNNPHKLAHATGADSTTKSMFAQHLHLMNTLTLKKLISSGNLTRPKKAAKTVPEPTLAVKAVVTQDPPIFAQLPRTTIVDVVEDKENAQSNVTSDEAAPRLVKRTVLQASTSELLRCFGVFLHGRFRNLSGDFSPHDPMLWLRGLDRNLIAQGWQDIGFINPANIVFLYLLVRGLRQDTAKSIRQLQSQVLTALYLSYSYMGHEISYPVKLFLYADDCKDDFWKRCLRLIDQHSEDMLRLNSDSAFFAKIFAELKSHGASKPLQYHF